MAKRKSVKKEIKEVRKEIALSVPDSFNPRSLLKPRIILAAILVLLVVLIFHFKGVFIAATVNGQPVTRLSIIQELEKEGGKSVLDNAITTDLVYQEAQKENVTATSTEINNQLNQFVTQNLTPQGQTLDAYLTSAGLTKDQFINAQIKPYILATKMAGKGITVTDQEISDNFKQNSANYPKGTKLADVSAQIKSEITQQKLSSAIQTWITNLRSKAKINYFVNY